MTVPGVEDHKMLAWEVWASFQLPKRASELHKMENYHQAPPALLCLLWRNFLPLPNSIFACWNIQEMQCEKMVAYAQALQYWAEKVDPPAEGRPCLLVKSVKELWEEMRCFLSFSDGEVFKGMVPPEEMSTIPPEEADPQSARTMPASTPEGEATMGTEGNQLWRGGLLSSLIGRRCCIHPNLWWLPGRSPIHWEIQDWGFATGKEGWFKSLKLNYQRWWTSYRKPPCLHKS